MNIGFQIPYRTVWGEEVCVQLTWFTKAGKGTSGELLLSTLDGQLWRGDMSVPATAVSLTYSYAIREGQTISRREWAQIPRSISISHTVQRLLLSDTWRDEPADSYFYTSAFTEAFLHRQAQPWPTVQGASKQLRIHVFAPEVPRGYTLAVLGSSPALGQWQQGQEVMLTPVGPAQWAFAVSLDDATGVWEYKYVVVDKTTGEHVWELHDNRCLGMPPAEGRMMVQCEDSPVHLPFAPWRCAGCVIPVFSLRSEHSYGVGDFGDLLRMVDWVALTGQHVLQILPINDTTLTGKWTDSYPYNAISIYALHPIYADLDALPQLKDASLRTSYRAMQQRLNALAHLDYEQVMTVKSSYLQRLFQQEWEEVKASKPYKQFHAANADWLQPYAAFCYLRDKYETPDFHRWGDMAVYSAEAIRRLNRRNPESVEGMAFHCYVQFLLHQQLSRVRQHAREKCVVLKGDIPIGISPCSVEAWTEPRYFHLDGQAGAPPDYFSRDGQNWGFPTYNWETMLADGCQWWRRRFQKMAEYFDAYRIDHVLGFFRIWEIPQHSVHGLLGHFAPALPMSVEEIEGFGLPWREHTYTEPYITDRILHHIFGDRTSDVRRLYMEPMEAGRYRLKSEYATQRQVQAVFAGKTDAQSTALRDGLYHLISNVLFLRDDKEPDHFHPRIVAMHDLLFEDLTDREKDAFCRIHEHYFHQRHTQFWYEQAMKKLPLLVHSTRMLVCAEDLGMIPECVPWVMNQFNILTLEIQTMPKQGWMQFANLWENPYRSVATISTHDMPTLRLWWDEQREASQLYFNHVLHHEGQAPHPLTPAVAEEVVARHLECPSMLCLLSLQDWFAIDEQLRNPHIDEERINVPANPRHYWRWRMHITIEQLMASTALNQRIHDLVKKFGR